MSGLYIKLYTAFFQHRKTARLKARLGKDALWIIPRLWAYAAENQIDGDFSGYSSGELAELLGCSEHAPSMRDALVESGYMDADGRLHDWEAHNGFHSTNSRRAKKAAEAMHAKRRAQKEPLPQTPTHNNLNVDGEGDRDREEHAPSMPGACSKQESDPVPSKTQRMAKARPVLLALNEASGRRFRETESNLLLIASRLEEEEVTVEGCIAMVQRQCAKWLNNPTMSEYLRPETLFNRTKFEGYYAARLEPIPVEQPRNGYSHQPLPMTPDDEGF